jgi:hypothetical protein
VTAQEQFAPSLFCGGLVHGEPWLRGSCCLAHPVQAGGALARLSGHARPVAHHFGYCTSLRILVARPTEAPEITEAPELAEAPEMAAARWASGAHKPVLRIRVACVLSTFAVGAGLAFSVGLTGRVPNTVQLTGFASTMWMRSCSRPA